MRNRSLKRAKQEREYKVVRKEYLEANPECEAKLKDCTGQATEIHHMAGRIGLLLCDTKNFKALCNGCHRWAELHPIEAKELGLSKSRLQTT